MKLGITMLIHNKDDIELVTEFPCLLGHPVLSFFHKSNVKPLKEANCKNPELTFRSLFVVGLLVASFVVYYNWHWGKGCCVHVRVAYKNCSGTGLKGVFAKNERGYRLYAIKKRF